MLLEESRTLVNRDRLINASSHAPSGGRSNWIEQYLYDSAFCQGADWFAETLDLLIQNIEQEELEDA